MDILKLVIELKIDDESYHNWSERAAEKGL